MKTRLRRLGFGVGLWFLWAGLSAGIAAAVAATADLPLAADVIAKIIERDKKVGGQKKYDGFAWRKTSVREELDTKGQVKSREEKVYDVIWRDGAPSNRLAQINGRALSEKEQMETAPNERKAGRAFTGAKPAKDDDKKEGHSLAELLARFQFQPEKRELLNGRRTLVFGFQPQSPAASSTIMDRVLNKLAGTVWIDEDDFEFARVEVHLTERVTLWGGLLAALDTFSLSLRWVRSDEGVWLNQSATTLLEGRQFVSAMRYRVTDRSSQFRRVAKDDPKP